MNVVSAEDAALADRQPLPPLRRGPGRPRVLSETEIVDAAVHLAREGGLSQLSMRAVARALNVSPMTIYGYVANKAMLDALVIDRILQGVRVPPPEEGTWESRLRMLLCDARRTLVERPQLADDRTIIGDGALQLLHHGVFGQEASRLADGVIDLLREGGFHTDDLHTCFVTLFIFVTGYADSSEPTIASEIGPATIEAPSATRSSAELFAIGVEAVIEGLKALLQPAPPTPRPEHHTS